MFFPRHPKIGNRSVPSRRLGPRAQRRRSVGFGPELEGLEERTVLSFFAPPTFAAGTSPHAQAVGDFNGDGKADLAVASPSSNTMSVLLGNGDGTFQPRTDYATGTSPWGVAVGDFNGDGKADVAVVNKGAHSVSVLLGNGDGTFQPRTDIALALTPVALTVGDFNGDGKADLAVATENATTDDMTLLLGNGNGTFQAPVTTVTDTLPLGAVQFIGGGQSSIARADFNGDGHLDLVVVNNKDVIVHGGRFGGLVGQSAPGTASVLLGNGDGTFQAPRNSALGGVIATAVAVGDFNIDGRPDFAASSDVALSVFMNVGSGNFSSSNASFAPGFSIPGGILAAGDFNGDGATDLAVPVTVGNFLPGVAVLNGQTGGGLQGGVTYALGMGAPVAGDFNGDGHLDLSAIATSANNGGFTNVVEPWLTNGSGTFSAPSFIPAGGVSLSSQASADFNGDGIPDLVSASSGQVQLGLGDGRFGDTTTLTLPSGSTVAAADADGNGTRDVLVGNPGYPSGLVAAWFNSPGYDNRTGGSVGFTVSAPAQIAAGDNTSVTITAVDAQGNPVPGFLGTVDLDFTPAGSNALNLAGQYTFTAADNGRHTFLFSDVTQAGAGSLSVFAAGMPTTTAPLKVVPAALNTFALAVPTSIPAGTPFSFTITPEDRFGNVETGYTGKVHFSALANDTQAVLPADYTFTSADAGTHIFGATLFKTAGTSAPFINAKDLATGVNTSGAVNVTPLAPASLGVTSLPSSTIAGTVSSVTVTALDVYGNRASSYTGTVHFSSSDSQASLPANYTFTAADGGSHSFSVTLKTAGTQSFGVADTSNAAFAFTQTGIVVSPATASVFVFTGLPASSTAGVQQTFTVTAEDSFGNVAPFFGTVHFSSSDLQASLPLDYTFTSADASRHTFSATLKTAGTQSLSLSTTFFGSAVGAQNVLVTAAAASAFQVSGFPATAAGVAHSFTVTALDPFGNVATGYTGTAAFSSSDPIASLPASYTFTAADAGIHTFTATLKRAGTQAIQAADTQVGSIVGAENGIAVSAAAVTHFAISGPATVTQGVGFKITVSAVDDFGNVNAGYRGSVHLSSTDSTGGTQNFTFSNNDNGVHIFSYTFNALGQQTITIVDTVTSAIAGSFATNVVKK
jgi:hypothetical protein